MMSIVRVTILTLLSLLIAGAAFIGQLAFRMDRTFLGFGYTQDALERWLSPLKNDEIRRDFVDDLLDDMRRALDWSMPSQLQAIMDDAAFENFSYDWMMNTVRRMHISVFRLMKGDNLSMELVIPLGGFTNTMVSMVRQDIPAEFSRQIESQLTRTPSSIAVWADFRQSAYCPVLYCSRVPLRSAAASGRLVAAANRPHPARISRH